MLPASARAARFGVAGAAWAVAAVVALSGACLPPFHDLTGKKCDATHTCPVGLECQSGRCAPADGGLPPPDGGGGGGGSAGGGGGGAPGGAGGGSGGGAVADAGECHRVVGPSGDDSDAGTFSAPWRTVQRLLNGLDAGETGCVHVGTYYENLAFPRGGVDGGLLVLRSYPGERARLVGRLSVPITAHHVVVWGFDLDGTNDAGANSSPQVFAADVRFSRNRVTSPTPEGCFNLGLELGDAGADRALIDHNEIFDCGPSTAANAAGIEARAGRNIEIRQNWILKSGGKGVRLSLVPRDALVAANAFVANPTSVSFEGDFGLNTTGTSVERNVMSSLDPGTRHLAAEWRSGDLTVGSANVARYNCYAGPLWTTAPLGYSESNNTNVSNVRFVNLDAGNLTLAGDSPCLGVLDGGLPTSRPTD